MSNELTAFGLAFVASLGTFAGGILAVALPKLLRIDVAGSGSNSKTDTLIGVLQAFAGGIMVHMTFFDLIPESIEKVGKTYAIGFFFVGIIVFTLLNYLVPETESASPAPSSKKSEKPLPSTPASASSSAINPKSWLKKRKTNGLDVSDSKKDEPSSDSAAHEKRIARLYRTSFVTLAAMTLHNLPEGLATYLASLNDLKLGSQMAAAIFVHNIPEGMAIAIPLWAATQGSTYKVLLYTFLNGLAEPLGVLIGGVALRYALGNNIEDIEIALSSLLAVVAGVMAAISLDELVPTSIQFAGRTWTSLSFWIGMGVCFIMLEAIGSFFDH
ncbi:Zinc/iron permease [Cladochytrium replicatum]|nr:Zinc/iron permease [Cladochytrium replicatum]